MHLEGTASGNGPVCSIQGDLEVPVPVCYGSFGGCIDPFAKLFQQDLQQWGHDTQCNLSMQLICESACYAIVVLRDYFSNWLHVQLGLALSSYFGTSMHHSNLDLQIARAHRLSEACGILYMIVNPLAWELWPHGLQVQQSLTRFQSLHSKLRRVLAADDMMTLYTSYIAMVPMP